MSRLPIADYALLSDCRSGALVSRDGSIDWLCLPRFDSASVFGRILDDAAGHWSIQPAEATGVGSGRRYLDGSLVLETTFTGATGSVALTDALVVGHDERGHGLGADGVDAVMRRVVGLAGSVELVLDFAPRPGYAEVAPTLHPFDGGVATHRLPDQLDRLGPAPRSFLAGLADTAATRWRDTDQGIWETRGGPRHFLYSKLMCWVALDRAIALADRLGALDRVDGWKVTRDEIADAIMTLGWNDEVGAFTRSFGSTELDASNLMMPIVGFIPASHPRMRATIDLTAADLSDEHGLIYRYRWRTASTARRGRSCCAPSCWPTRRRWPATSRPPGRRSGSPRGTRTTWDSSPRRSTHRTGSSSATSPRRSATSGW